MKKGTRMAEEFFFFLTSGREVFIKARLQVVTSYVMSTFRILKSLCDEL